MPLPCHRHGMAMDYHDMAMEDRVNAMGDHAIVTDVSGIATDDHDNATVLPSRIITLPRHDHECSWSSMVFLMSVHDAYGIAMA